MYNEHPISVRIGGEERKNTSYVEGRVNATRREQEIAQYTQMNTH